MHERGAAAASGREAVGRHLHHRVEIGSRDIPVRPRASHEREEIVLRVFGRRRLRDDLLRQHVERRVVRHDAIELALPH